MLICCAEIFMDFTSVDESKKRIRADSRKKRSRRKVGSLERLSAKKKKKNDYDTSGSLHASSSRKRDMTSTSHTLEKRILACVYVYSTCEFVYVYAPVVEIAITLFFLVLCVTHIRLSTDCSTR